MRIREWQLHIRRTFHDRDVRRGLARNFMWLVEEVGELSEALRFGTRRKIESEFADCYAWLTGLATLAGVDVERALLKYRRGCPVCKARPCSCPMEDPDHPGERPLKPRIKWRRRQRRS